jgi:hypothetical protein
MTSDKTRKCPIFVDDGGSDIFQETYHVPCAGDMRDSVILSLNFCAALKHKYQDDVLCENSFSFFS